MTVIIPGLYGLESSAAWRALQKDPQKYIDKFAKDKTVQSEIDYFTKKAGTFKDVDALLKDRRATQYLLDAYGLGSEINNTGRLKKILTQDPTADDSLVNQLADGRFKTMAASLRLDTGMDKLQRSTFIDLVKDKYIQNEFEVNLGQQDPALRQAAYFARLASSNSISDVYNVLGDSVLRDVITTTFSIPPQLAIQPVESQAAALSSRIDFKKFVTSATAVSQTTLSRAKTDFTLLQTSLGTSDKAIAQIKLLQGQLAQLSTDYGNLATTTDPSGPNSATIALQQTAIPDLLRSEQLINAGKSATDLITSRLSTLNGLITQAQSPTADLNDLKSQFSIFVNSINSAIDNATITAPDGSTQNILQNGTADTLTIILDDIGTTVTINRYDADNIKNSVNSALASFNAVTDSSDMANINAASGRLLIAADQNNAIKTTLASDLSTMKTKIAAEPFYATLNTVSLQKGADSVSDSLSRLTKIEDIIKKIGALATQSKGLSSGSDRTDLETQFNDYRAQLRSLISTVGIAGTDNFLNNAPDQTYNVTTGADLRVKGNYDLLSTVADVLDAGSLSDQASATALETSAILVTNATDSARKGLQDSQPYLDRALNTYDPHGRLDNQIYKLKAGISDFIAAAKSDDGKNLLDPAQKDISLNLTTGNTVKLRAQATFQSSLTTGLDDLVTQINSGNVNNILSSLNDLQYMVDSTGRTLGSDNRNGTLELGKLGGIIDTLDTKDSSSDNTTYKVNAFTEKFLNRYLTQVFINNGGSTSTASGKNSYLTSLFSGSNNTSSAMTSIFSLSVKV